MAISDSILVQLDQLLKAIQALPDPRRATAEWKQIYQHLKKTPAAGNHLDNLVARRDVASLITLLDEHRPSAAVVIDPGSQIDDATLKAAMKGFRRRLKLIKLDEESKLDLRDPMSKGQGAEIAAIEPPREWPPEVWAELAKRGALRRAGSGLYQFVQDLPG